MSKKKWPRLHVDNWILRIDEPGQTEIMTTAEHEARLAAAEKRIKKLRAALEDICFCFLGSEGETKKCDACDALAKDKC